jgi:hypothetical protein
LLNDTVFIRHLHGIYTINTSHACSVCLTDRSTKKNISRRSNLRFRSCCCQLYNSSSILKIAVLLLMS